MAEKWIDVYQSALMELEHSLMAGRIAEARDEIVARVEQLRGIPGLHRDELRAIDDALGGLRVLECEESRDAKEQERVAAEQALEKLRSIGPTMERLRPTGEQN